MKTLVAVKTPLLAPFVSRLANLNDQFCYFLFASEEIDRRLSDFSEEIGHHFTSQVFANNSKSKRIYVTLDKLPDFKNNNEKFTFGAYFSTSYEIVTGYLESILNLLKSISGPTFVISKKDTPEESLQESLRLSNFQLPDIELIETLSYMRLRRNNFTHLHTKPNNPLSTLITNRGSSLNSYWGGSISKLDFTNTNLNDYTELETIDLLKVLRLIVEKLDECLAGSINANDIIAYLLSAIHVSDNGNRLVKEENASKLKQLARMDFGLQMKTKDIFNLL